MADDSGATSIGASITADQLTLDPYGALADLQAHEPVSFLPELGAWFVTGRAEALEAMRDPDRFTVDDPRFSTGAVLGTSMLNLDGPEHDRHRSAFAPVFRPRVVREEFQPWLEAEVDRLIDGFVDQGSAELRLDLAGPLAVNTITHVLGLADVRPDDVLVWYHLISEAIVDVTLGREISTEAEVSIHSIKERVTETLGRPDWPSILHDIAASEILRPDELAPETAVVMFGGIETNEGMTANVFWHLLNHPETLERVRDDRSLVHAAVQESLRLEPAAAVVDRYTTGDVEIGGVTIPEGQLVTISLTAANRDPATFPDPDVYDIDRPNHAAHVTFVQGPHACLGVHLARAQTEAAVNGVLERCPDLVLDAAASAGPRGLIFRKAQAVEARWVGY